MGKGILIVALFSICTITMFCVMVYLMTTVNPPPLEPHLVVLRTPATPAPPRQKFDHIFFDVGDSVPVIDPALYGLDKAEVEEIDFYPVTIRHVTNINLQNITGVFRFTRRKLLQPLWPRTLQTIMIGPTVHKVLPLIWPTLTPNSTVIVDSTSPISPSVKLGKNTELQNSTNSYTDSNINSTIEKPMKRRSVSNKVDDYTGSVLLKILDYDGQPRIEIKLGSDNFLLNKSKSSKTLINNNTIFNMAFSDSNEILKDNDFAKDTVITIMSNNTVVIDELNDNVTKQKNVSRIENNPDLVRSLILATKTDEIDKEISVIGLEDKLQLNKPEMILSYGNMSLKVLQNETIFNVNDISNSSIYDIYNNKTGAKYDGKNDTNINIKFDNIGDMKFNNTKFIESVFEEEEINNFKGLHETMSGYITNQSSKQTTKKDTGAFIENDSDILIY